MAREKPRIAELLGSEHRRVTHEPLRAPRGHTTGPQSGSASVRDTQLSVYLDQPDRRGHVLDRSRERVLADFGRTSPVGCPPAHSRVAVPLYRKGQWLCLQITRGPSPFGSR